MWGKAKSFRVSNLSCRGAESPERFDVVPKNPAQDVIHEWVCCCDEAGNHQSPIAAAVFVVLRLSTNEEHCSASYLLSGLEGCNHNGQHLPNQKVPLKLS